MDNLLKNLVKYIEETLGLSVKPVPWNGSDVLPLFLQEPYGFYLVKIHDPEFLLMAARNHSKQTPVTVRNHIDQVRKYWKGDVIYVNGRINSYNRRRLIDHRISFIVPGNQMYLPLLGLDLREYFRNKKPDRSRISPSAQAVIIYALVNGTERVFTLSNLADKLGYTPMTISRVLDEIEHFELGTCANTGRERLLKFTLNKKNLWIKAREQMRSPVKKRIAVGYQAKDYLGIQAGLTALAYYSMLNAPVIPVFCIGSRHWNKIRHNAELSVLPHGEDGTYEVEVWAYDPALLSDRGVADPFSLYMSLMSDRDERTQASLEEMMGGIKW